MSEATCVVGTAISSETPLSALPLSMSYTPMQKWENLYDPENGLERGTLFACLDLPFIGKEATENGKQ